MRIKPSRRFTRIYTWKRKSNRGRVNLQRHIGKINDALNKVLPNNYDAYVSVGRDDFVIDTAFPIEPRQAQLIGEELAKVKAIGQLCKPYNYSHGRRSNQIFVGTDISL